GSIAVHRAGFALVHGDVVETVRHARRALQVLAEDDVQVRGAAGALMGLASWTSGDLETAYHSYAEGMANLQQAGFIADTIGGSTSLADIRIAQGRLRDAMSMYQRSLRLAAGHGATILRGTADMYVGMADLHREWN